MRITLTRRTEAALAAVSALSLTSACGSSSSSGSTSGSSGSAANSGKVTLAFVNWDGGMQSLVDRWNQARQTVPAALWERLREEGLLAADMPVPGEGGIGAAGWSVSV